MPKYRVIKRDYLSFARNIGDVVEIADEELVNTALEAEAIVPVGDEKAVKEKKVEKSFLKKVAKKVTRKE